MGVAVTGGMWFRDGAGRVRGHGRYIYLDELVFMGGVRCWAFTELPGMSKHGYRLVTDGVRTACYFPSRLRGARRMFILSSCLGIKSIACFIPTCSNCLVSLRLALSPSLIWKIHSERKKKRRKRRKKEEENERTFAGSCAHRLFGRERVVTLHACHGSLLCLLFCLHMVPACQMAAARYGETCSRMPLRRYAHSVLWHGRRTGGTVRRSYIGGVTSMGIAG
jgi:hypothetical protein